MLQVPFIRENKDLVINRLAVRNIDASTLIEEVINLDEERRALQTKLDAVLAESNAISKEIGILYKSGQAEKANALKAKTADFKDESKELNDKLTTTAEALNQLLYKIPNIPHATVPKGNSEEDNEEVYAEGESLNYMMVLYHIGN